MSLYSPVGGGGYLCYFKYIQEVQKGYEAECLLEG